MTDPSAPAGAQAAPEEGALVPYISADQSPREFTWRAVILGVLMAFIFNAANAYVGLKIGLTVSASIPSAVISMALLRKFLPRLQRIFGVKNAEPGTILENNTAHAVASTGEALAGGIIFTMPAFYFLTARPGPNGELLGGHLLGTWETFAYGVIGGLLGIFAMIPLRQYLTIKEHRTLPFPEGLACAKVLVAGDQGGVSAKPVFYGILTGLAGKFMIGGLGLWQEEVVKSYQSLHKATIGFNSAPLGLGVGYLIGPRIAAVMLAGSVLGYCVLTPLFDWLAVAMCGQTIDLHHVMCHAIPPGTTSIVDMSADDIRGAYIKYIGAGGVAFGGAWGILSTMPDVGSSLRSTLRALRLAREGKVRIPRTERDIPLKWVGLALLVLVLAIAFLPAISGGHWGIGVALLMAAIAALFSFFFVSVSAQTVGMLGSTSQPVSGMTITVVLASALIIAALGYTGIDGRFAAMTIGAIVCISICLSGDMAQDLKTGALIGATPRAIQYGQIIGTTWAALRAGSILAALHYAYHLGSPQLSAPQSNLMASLVQGVMQGGLPWALLLLGAGIGLAIEMCGMSALAFSIGLYLPISTWPPILVGGIMAWIVQRKTGSAEQKHERHERGTLFASGLVAGDALMGIVIAILTVAAERAGFSVPLVSPETMAHVWGAIVDFVPLAAFGAFAFILLRVSWAKSAPSVTSKDG